MRFLADENVPGPAVRGLQMRGVDIVTVVELGFESAADDAVLDVANAEERVIVTHDDDFTRIDRVRRDHYGICYCHPEKHSIGSLIEMLVLVEDCYGDDELNGRIEYL